MQNGETSRPKNDILLSSTEMKIGKYSFAQGTHVMAIINLTPDSFYSASRTDEKELLTRVKTAISQGAEVIDIGGQSTRPDHVAISPQEEWKRIENAVSIIKDNFDIPLSVDTYYPYVASKALQKGADLINDVWGLQYRGDDSCEMAKTIAEFNASVCIMHNQTAISADDELMENICAFFDKSIQIAKSAGISDDKIMLDGGIGFGKTREQNFYLVENYEKLHRLPYPLLLGTSRKSMFGGNVEDRLAPTLQTTRLAVQKGVLFVRVHDVKENKETIRSEEAKLNNEPN